MFGCSNMLCLLASTWYQRVYGCPAYAKQSLSSAWLTKHKNVTSFSTSFLKPKVKSIKKNHFLHDEPYQWKFDSSLLTLKCYMCKVFDSAYTWKSDWQSPGSVSLNPSAASRQQWGQSERPGAAPTVLAQLHCSSKQCVTHKGNILIKQRNPRSSQSKIVFSMFSSTPLFPNTWREYSN